MWPTLGSRTAKYQRSANYGVFKEAIMRNVQSFQIPYITFVRQHECTMTFDVTFNEG